MSALLLTLTQPFVLMSYQHVCGAEQTEDETPEHGMDKEEERKRKERPHQDLA